MRRDFLILTFLFLLTLKTFAEEIQIKSLRVYSSINETSLPVIDNSDPLKKFIIIEFDVQSSYAPNLNIVFKFCNKDWEPYDNVFLANYGFNTEYNLNLEKLPLRVTDARYHYIGKFPNKNVTFPFSGKWKFYITDSHDPNKIYGEDKFYVVYPEVDLKTSIEKKRLEYVIPEFASLGRTINIKTFFKLSDTLYYSYIELIEIIENKKILYPIMIEKDKVTDKYYFEWNGINEFLFIAKDIKPGNEYRQTDLRDTNKFFLKNVNAQYDGIEVSDFYKKRKKDFNGGAILIDYKSEYAEYMNVTFKLRAPENLNSSIFLTGEFNNWQILPEFEMTNNDGLFYLTTELKRGIYDYQYVTAVNNNGEIKNIDWYALEGNFWETENDYHIFLFYKTQEKGGYDKIIGYKKINSGEL